MKKFIFTLLISLLVIPLFGCDGVLLNQSEEPQNFSLEKQTSQAEIHRVVEGFGERLKYVSLLDPKGKLLEEMEENYGEYVLPELFEQWVNDITNAPGRLTSSPWPDRIEILNTEKISDLVYKVEGEIVEIASSDLNEIDIRKPIVLEVKEVEGKWFICEVRIGGYGGLGSVVLKNEPYGFTFSLPESWKGYTIIDEIWKGVPSDFSKEETINTTGPMLIIRHPNWSLFDQRQDIPIMILTHKQWEAFEKESLRIGEATIKPKKLAQNNKYIFALPPRYNYAFPTGYEEVEKILEGNPLKAINGESK